MWAGPQGGRHPGPRGSILRRGRTQGNNHSPGVRLGDPPPERQALLSCPFEEELRLREGKQLAQGYTAGCWWS